MYFFLGFIFVARNCVQGIGRSAFVLAAGASELVARVVVCMFVPAALAGGQVSAAAPAAAFYGLCAADPVAWMAADLALLTPFVKNIMKQDYRYMHQPGVSGQL